MDSEAAVAGMGPRIVIADMGSWAAAGMGSEAAARTDSEVVIARMGFEAATTIDMGFEGTTGKGS